MSNQLTEAQQENFFKKISHREENGNCADCKVRGATWVSLDFGVIICINCSGVHRSLGMHITRVRSIKLDNWNVKDTKFIDLVGNQIANNYWEFTRKENRTRQIPDSDRASFIRQKYISKTWTRHGYKDPVSLLKEKDFQMTREQLASMYSLSHKTPSLVNVGPKSSDNFVSLNETQGNPEIVLRFKREGHEVRGQAKSEDVDLLNLDTDKVLTKKETTDAHYDFDFNLNNKPTLSHQEHSKTGVPPVSHTHDPFEMSLHQQPSHSKKIDKHCSFEQPTFLKPDVSSHHKSHVHPDPFDLKSGSHKNDSHGLFDYNPHLVKTAHHHNIPKSTEHLFDFDLNSIAKPKVSKSINFPPPSSKTTQAHDFNFL